MPIIGLVKPLWLLLWWEFLSFQVFFLLQLICGFPSLTVNMVDFIDLFSCIESALNSQNKLHLIVIYYSSYILLDSIDFFMIKMITFTSANVTIVERFLFCL